MIDYLIILIVGCVVLFTLWSRLFGAHKEHWRYSTFIVLVVAILIVGFLANASVGPLIVSRMLTVLIIWKISIFWMLRAWGRGRPESGTDFQTKLDARVRKNAILRFLLRIVEERH